MQLFPDFGSSKLAVNAANSASAAAASAAQAAVSANNAAVQGTISSAVTLSAGSTAAVSVTLSNNNLLTVSTSLRGILSTIIGILERSAGGSYTFTPATAPLATITIPTGSLFVASATPENLNPINIDGHVLSRDSIYTEFGYASVMLDNTNRLAWGTLTNGTLFANKPAQMSITGNAATATTATTAVTAISAITATSADTATSATTAASATTATTASSALSLTLPNGTTIYNDSSIDEFYNSVFLDSQNRISWGVLLDGSLFASKPAQMSITGNAATATTATTSTTATTAQSLTLPGGTTIFGDSSFDGIYSSVFVDSQNRIAWGISLDGTLFASKTAQMSISGNAATATTATTATVAQSVQSLVTAGGDRLQDYVNLDFYYDVEVDDADRIFRAIRSDGTNYMPKAAVDSLSAVSATVQTLTVNTLNATNFSTSQFTAVHGADGVFAVEAVSGTNQIIRYNTSNGARTQLTTIGANTAPSLTAETPARILFTSTRTGSQTYQVMKTDGSELASAIPPKTIVMWGDSMTAGLSSSGWLPTKLGDGRTIRFRGVGGQTSVQIASRQNGLTITGTVAGGQIPASGAVAVTGLYPSPVTAQGGDGLYSINGIIGALAFNGGSPTFTRSTAGSAVSVTNPATIIPVLDDTINSVVYNLNEYTAVLWLGRNGIGGSQGETDVSIYTAMLSKFRNLTKRILILSIFNGGYSTESDGDTAIPTIGTSGYTNIMSRNASVAAAFPQNWYDIRRQFIDGAEAWLSTKYPAIYASDWTQAFPDRTQDSLGPNSAWDVANDVPPRALRRDNIHLNDYGNEFLAELVAAKIQSLNW